MIATTTGRGMWNLRGESEGEEKGIIFNEESEREMDPAIPTTELKLESQRHAGLFRYPLIDSAERRGNRILLSEAWRWRRGTIRPRRQSLFPHCERLWRSERDLAFRDQAWAKELLLPLGDCRGLDVVGSLLRMALHRAQRYCPLNVICTASGKGTISEYSRTMLTQTTHWRTGHWPPQERTNATRTIMRVPRRMLEGRMPGSRSQGLAKA